MLQPAPAMSRSVQAVRATRRRSRVPAFSSLPAFKIGLVVLPFALLAGITLFELGNWDKITPGVNALGVPIGGLATSEAVARLSPGVQQLLDRPLDIQGGDQTWHTTARALGLRLDPAELVAAAYAVGRQGSSLDRLGDQIDSLLFGRVISPASTTDRPALDAALATMASQVDRTPIDASLGVNQAGEVQFSQAQDGLAIDVTTSRERLTAALDGDSRTVELATSAVPPSISDQQLQDARDQLDRLLGPDAHSVTATFGDNSWKLEHADVAKLVTLTGATQPGQPAVVKIDDGPIRAWVSGVAKDLDQSVQDARFQFNGGNLKVLQPSKQGRELNQDATVQLVHEALLGDNETFELPVATVEPSISSDDPQSLGITELIDRGSTSFAGSVPEKKANIKLAAQRLNGVVVAPGATFSFNDAVGPTTLDAGFQWGFGIESGSDGPRTVPSVAGGICQVATTLFQPVFWSGFQLEERYWHLYWIPAYTSRGVVGLDVTVDSESGVDFKWTNTTRDYVLIQADTDDSNVYFGLYGKKPPWKVQVDDAVVSNRVPPDTTPLAEPEPTLPWGRTILVETARDGFDVQVTRHVIPDDGTKARELVLRSTYQPAHTVTLVGTEGKPANASVDDVIQRVLNAQKPAEAKPNPTAAPISADTTAAAPTAQPRTTQPSATAQPGSTAAQSGTNTAQHVSPTAQPAPPPNQIAPTPAPAAARPAAPTAAPAAKPSAPTPAPQPTTKPATSSKPAGGPAPTAPPGH
jgi:vancomycin resistance protein YoaR